MPRVTVIIVSYNAGADRLERMLASLAAQTFTDFEILLLDNNSTDGCVDDLPVMQNMRLIRSEENLGFAGGVNRAATQARGDWLALLNPDAVADPDWLTNLMRGTQRYPDTKSFGAVQLNADDPALLDGLGDVYHATGIAWRGGFGQSAQARPDTDREIFAPCGAAALYERATFEKLGGLEESFFCYHEDVDLGARLRLDGGRSIMIADAVILHEGSGTTGRYSDFTIYHGARNRIWTFIRVMPPPLFWPILPIHILINFAFVLRGLITGTGPAYFHGMKDGFLKADKAWAARRALQQTRKVSALDFLKALSWSPVRLLGRKPVMREIK
ncbi:glycosyltransferase family 2 protein [Parvularcula sp. IMCC14364]|uniref:glycosyltransferase family 2 protein n=1 Tax=Parvularcula sp. IMCC14364 TaxID=3067902 RepID=UPI00274199EF|nr:glycosyltransferase family 2 protein [Parvularcula sp. IMCC14364]